MDLIDEWTVPLAESLLSMFKRFLHLDPSHKLLAPSNFSKISLASASELPAKVLDVLMPLVTIVTLSS
jgi:hypothetical protein